MAINLFEALKGTHGEESEALKGVTANVSSRIREARQDGRLEDSEELSHQRDNMLSAYQQEGRIDSGEHTSPLLQNIRDTKP